MAILNEIFQTPNVNFFIRFYKKGAKSNDLTPFINILD